MPPTRLDLTQGLFYSGDSREGKVEHELKLCAAGHRIIGAM